ncbi:hypothetical protein NDN08_006983 [Rhodosorus marinus]|uniref:Uncharacterized protein n=1 Tax=Rhodosorus marinus TaxID=101924 RepID=A0AAV8UMT6_9RHOD|nr:hypothetical protein NDN08_006983 [Rhodosorus marinus]
MASSMGPIRRMAFGLNVTGSRCGRSSGNSQSPRGQLKRVGIRRSLGRVRWTCADFRKPALWTAWASYVYVAFFSQAPPGDNVFNAKGALVEAINLSLNFWFVTPAFLPQLAPLVDPGLEAIFNFTVIYGFGLILGFLSDGGEKQKTKITPFVVGSAFLTNAFYLLYLALRKENTVPPTREEMGTVLFRASESKLLPLLMLGVAGISLWWSAFGRGGDNFGDIHQRWTALIQILSTDRLAWTFLLDSAIFALFQGALVPDDMARRKFSDPTVKNIASFVPFFGIIFYLLVRPKFDEVQS